MQTLISTQSKEILILVICFIFSWLIFSEIKIQSLKKCSFWDYGMAQSQVAENGSFDKRKISKFYILQELKTQKVYLKSCFSWQNSILFYNFSV